MISWCNILWLLLCSNVFYQNTHQQTLLAQNVHLTLIISTPGGLQMPVLLLSLTLLTSAENIVLLLNFHLEVQNLLLFQEPIVWLAIKEHGVSFWLLKSKVLRTTLPPPSIPVMWTFILSTNTHGWIWSQITKS